MHKAIFLDKDGTLVDSSGYPFRIPSDKLLWNDIEKGLHYLQTQGYLLFIVSNQAWVAKKRATSEQIESYFQSVVTQLQAKNITITQYYFCPHAPKDDCSCRKPHPYFLHQAAKKYNLDLSQSYFIGDADTDIQTGKNAGTKTILVTTGQGKSFVGKVVADFIIKNVDEVTKML
ncbi:HAD-IIIA family hydrolase [Candidatus Woesearchaeota archaeon]|nr:HAD-IIIA family hydrolase [Candidatus Woesearchaeota archaeon]